MQHDVDPHGSHLLICYGNARDDLLLYVYVAVLCVVIVLHDVLQTLRHDHEHVTLAVLGCLLDACLSPRSPRAMLVATRCDPRHILEYFHFMIRLLDRETIERLAAGEMMQSATQALKELLENALDAGAGCVELTV